MVGLRLLLRPRAPVLLLLVAAPAIPERMTGSTSLTTLVLDPPLFGLQLAWIVGLYGTLALLVQEFTTLFGRGWAPVLLLAAAYGILEEGVGVHTFFQSSGAPVGVSSAYDRLAGVN